MDNEKNNVHKGHRDRVKKSVLQNGTEYLQPHQLMEALLFYSIPQADVNELAHELIEKFGNIRGVMEADPSELMNIKGVGENTAAFFKLIQAAVKKYDEQGFEKSEKNNKEKYNSPEKIKPLAVKLFEGLQYERSYVLSFNSKFAYLGYDLVSEGDHHSTPISKQKTVEIAARRRATFIVLAHNHPDGDVTPSEDDIRSTKELKNALEQVDYHLIEHIIVSGKSAYAFSENGLI